MAGFWHDRHPRPYQREADGVDPKPASDDRKAKRDVKKVVRNEDTQRYKKLNPREEGGSGRGRRRGR